MAAAALKPVYALVGSDSFLQLQKLNELLSLSPGAQRIDFDGERADLAEPLDELRSFAMFGTGKIVVIQSADDFVSRFREQLEEYVAHPSGSATLVLRMSSLPKGQRIYKAIAAAGIIEECEPPKDLARWIADRGKSAYKLTVDPNAARLLADLIGDDLGRLDNELAKLAISAKDGKITGDQIADGVAFQRERQMSELTNAVASGRPAEAIKRWRQLVRNDPSTEFRAVTWLAIWLANVRKALAMLKQGTSAAAIPQRLRLWPPEIHKPFMQTAQALGETGAARAIDLLAEIDLQSKSGIGDAAENVERFILTMAIPHDSAV
jgi:DNA polymerase III subunit delta